MSLRFAGRGCLSQPPVLNSRIFGGTKGALRIPSLSFQYLRRPGCTAKLLCFLVADGYTETRRPNAECAFEMSMISLKPVFDRLTHWTQKSARDLKVHTFYLAAGPA